MRERSKMSAADCAKYGSGQHGTRAARNCDLLTPTVVVGLKRDYGCCSEIKIFFGDVSNFVKFLGSNTNPHYARALIF